MKSSGHRKNARAGLAAGLAASIVASVAGGAAAADWGARDADIRQEIILSPGIGGLRLPQEVRDFPVAVRLSSQTLSFDDLGDTADGLSVYDADGAVIPHYVENYNPAARIATLWLGVDRLNPADPARPVYLYYGDGGDGSTADPAAVFSAYRGFFDFSVPATDPSEPEDADEAPVEEEGGEEEAGETPRVTVPNLAGDGELAGLRTTPGFAGDSLQLFQEAGHPIPDLLGADAEAFTLSFWWRSTENAGEATILSGQTAAGPVTLRLEGGRPTVDLPPTGTGQEAGEAPGEQEGGAESPDAIAGQTAFVPSVWHHLALRYDGEIVSLFVDGERIGERRRVGMAGLRDILVGSAPRPEQGGDQAGDTDAPALLGLMDNVAIAATPLSDITLFAASQADAGRGLVSFGPEQERAGLFDFSYMITVLINVTLEGWVVIAICMILLIIAILVMAAKSAHIARVEGRNREFSKEFDRRFSRELLSVQAEPMARRYRVSTLAELFDTAAAELDEAAAEVTNDAGPEFDTGRVAALRARLNRKLIEQDNRLSKRLVLLTFAIAGGPFLGLLGTVIGVMITFAAIAEEGNVDITAVGPGVAAALLTTVAGLAVAIPSLFGYNMILPRIKAIKADGRSFAETLVARISQRFGTRA